MEDLKIRFNEYCDILDDKYKKLLIKLYNDVLKCSYIKDKDKRQLSINYLMIIILKFISLK